MLIVSCPLTMLPKMSSVEGTVYSSARNVHICMHYHLKFLRFEGRPTLLLLVADLLPIIRKSVAIIEQLIYLLQQERQFANITRNKNYNLIYVLFN